MGIPLGNLSIELTSYVPGGGPSADCNRAESSSRCNNCTVPTNVRGLRVVALKQRETAAILRADNSFGHDRAPQVLLNVGAGASSAAAATVPSTEQQASVFVEYRSTGDDVGPSSHSEPSSSVTSVAGSWACPWPVARALVAHQDELHLWLVDEYYADRNSSVSSELSGVRSVVHNFVVFLRPDSTLLSRHLSLASATADPGPPSPVDLLFSSLLCFFSFGVSDFIMESYETFSVSLDDLFANLSSGCMPKEEADAEDDDGVQAALARAETSLTTIHLRQYQRDAVRWMINRELMPSKYSGESSTSENTLHPLWVKHDAALPYWINKCSPPTLFFHRYRAGVVVERSQLVRWLQTNTISPLRGGILADEMGLGKTVECIALMLANRVGDTITNKRSLPLSYLSENSHDVHCCCGCRHDDGTLMLQCDACHRWQHVDCVFGCETMAQEVPLEWYCELCLAYESKESVLAGTTLIVCPAPILSQWHHEILSHAAIERTNLDSGETAAEIAGLSVFVYEGVARSLVQPAQLALFDVVLTTYDVLRSDLHHIGARRSNARAGTRKYASPRSPLCFVHFHRIFLDECQMIDSAACKAAKMARSIHADCRWVVSGTPFRQNWTDDLRGLLLFLGVSPYGDSSGVWWRQLTLSIATPPLSSISGTAHRQYRQNRDHLVQFLKPILWRTYKRNVQSQLGIPEQKLLVHTLTFSAVEKYFYDRVAEDVRAGFPRDARTSANGLASILRLRKACCHPQMALTSFSQKTLSFRQENTSGSAPRLLAEGILSMTELLERLIMRAHVERGEFCTQLASSLNGLAACCAIAGDRVAEVDFYKRVLALGYHYHFELSENERAGSYDRLDTVQLVHALYHLQAALAIDRSENQISVRVAVGRETSVRSLSLDDLSAWETTLRDRFVEAADSDARQAFERLQVSKKGCEKTLTMVGEGIWLHAAFRANSLKVSQTRLLADINEILSHSREAGGGQLESCAHLLWRFNSAWPEILSARLKLVTQLQSVQGALESKDVLAFASCARCSYGPRPESSASDQTIEGCCRYCVLEDCLGRYEQRLFRQRNGGANMGASASLQVSGGVYRTRQATASERVDEHSRNNATTLPSECELIVRGVSAAMQPSSRNASQDLSATSRAYVECFYLLKDEYLRLSNCWQAERERIAARDELRQAEIRIRLQTPAEMGTQLSAADSLWKLLPDDVPLIRRKLEIDLSLAQSGEQRSSVQIEYLGRLAIEEEHKHAARTTCAEGTIAKNTELVPTLRSCPICLEDVGAVFVVLPCGHSYCDLCIEIMSKRAKSTISCPQCRQRTNLREVSFVQNSDAQLEALASVSSNESQFSASELSVEIIGSWSTKIVSILKLLLNIRDSDVGAKTLVFSEWEDVLDILTAACSQNKLEFVRLRHQRDNDRLICFKDIGGPNILFLSSRSCSHGLNITEATHVIFVEPALLQSVEAQAVGRIHRIGQNRATYIHRCIVDESVEYDIWNHRKSDESQFDENATSLVSSAAPLDISHLRSLVKVSGDY